MENAIKPFSGQTLNVLAKCGLKVDREDHFWRPGFLHIIICVFLGYKASNLVKKIGCYRCLKNLKFEGFDRESLPRPFKTMFPRSEFFAFLWNESI